MWKRVSLNLNTAAMIEMDFQRRFPKAVCEIFLRNKGGGRDQYWTGSFGAALKHLETVCSSCTGLYVRYRPDHPYGMVCTVGCDCPRPERMCLELNQRPRAMMVVVHDGKRDVLVGNSIGPASTASSGHGIG